MNLTDHLVNNSTIKIEYHGLEDTDPENESISADTRFYATLKIAFADGEYLEYETKQSWVIDIAPKYELLHFESNESELSDDIKLYMIEELCGK